MSFLPSSPPDVQAATSQSYLLLAYGVEVYALPGTAVREVMRYRSPLLVPGAPAMMPGVVGQRGVVLTVVDLRHVLGLPVTSPTRATRYVVVQHAGVDLALVAERVLDFVELPQASFAPLPAALDPARARFLLATARYEEQLVVLLDLDALLAALRQEA